MSENRSYRINTNINKDNVVNVQISQDIDCLEILSLKINQVDTYRLQSANYGVIVGRVLANDGFGVPNVKVSVFIELDKVDKENPDITTIYPYTSMQTRDKDGRKYNLLPDNDNGNGDCYRIVGMFPNKRLVLDNENQLEVFDKYWKYTTVTNNAGDYMIFGVPVGVHTVHIDCDLSDIGILSQKPRDFYYKGYEKTNFENASQFKASTTLEDLVQIISQDKSIQVYPFWGDKDNSDVIALSRCDLNLAYKFEPTCVFMGSVITDDYSNAIGHNCSPSSRIGYNDTLTTNSGTIEMIRKTPDGAVEEYQIQGNELIDGDGVWCYQIPMNLDYIKTDEYGNIVPTDNPNEGIPTRTCARFRISTSETFNEGTGRHRAKYLVPNNMEMSFDGGHKLKNVKEFENCYEFGSKTQDSDFRNMYWNKIYSVKNYIPRIQTNNKSRITNYTGIRSVNIGSTNNPHPFNKMRITLKFGYVVTCILMTVIFMIVGFLNVLISLLLEICVLPDFMNPCPFGMCLPQYCIFQEWPFNLKCISFNFPNVGPSGEDETYAPMCWEHEEGVRTSWNDLVDRMQQALAMEYDLVNLDFHNDWINGTLYMPLWFWKKTKKKKYLWGLFSKKAVNTYCACDKVKSKTRVYDSCALPLTSELIPRNGQQSSAEKASSHYKFGRGVIQEITVSTNKDDLKVYYYATGLAKTDNTYTHLFATDLILLGSFNKCDWDNMPNVVSYLPPTTANIPFMTTVREVDENSADTPFNDITPGGGNPNGDVTGPGNGNINGGKSSNVTPIESTAEITGMDWTHNGKDNAYVPGLFLDIACAGTTTLTKTCYNLKRLCELGVDLDSGYVIAVPEGNKGEMKEVQVDADGLVLYQDIGDHESRAMFATLNHNSLKSSIRNNITTYNNHLLYYMYPQNFDGGMTYAAKNVKSTLKDMQDSDYRKFRYGTYEEPQLGNINRYSESFPIYNNSFYFYFGLKQGKTAIEKFRNLYDAACRTNTKYGFSIGVETKNSSVCSEGDGSITITLENAHIPCSVTLYNGFKEEKCFSGDTNVLNEVECTDKENGTPTEGLRDMSSLPYSKFTLSGLTNDSYTLEIVDASNKTIVENVVLTQELATVYTLGSSLIGKYDPMNESDADSLTKAECGILTLYDFIIEGEEIDGINLPSSISIDGNNSFIIEAQNKKVKCTISYISDSEFETEPNDFLHKDSKTVNLEVISITTEEKAMGYRLYVKKNGTYVITIQQMCGDDLKGAKTTVRQVIGNGTKFTLYVNDVDVTTIQNNGGNTYWSNVNAISNYKLPLTSYTDSNIETWLNYVDGMIETGLIQDTPTALKVDEEYRISDENKLNILDCISYQEKLINAINKSDYVVVYNEDFKITNEILRLLNEGGGEDILYYSGNTVTSPGIAESQIIDEFDAFVNKLYETPTTKPTKDNKDASGNPIYSGDTDTNLIKDVQKYYSVLPKYYCNILNRINIFQMVEKINDIYNEYNSNIDDYNEKVDKILKNDIDNRDKETLLFDLFSILNNIIGLYEKLQANSSEYELFDEETGKILKIKLTDSSFGISHNINLMNNVLYGDIDGNDYYNNISNYINNILNIYVQTLLNPPQEILENNALIILNKQLTSLCKMSKASYVTSEGGNTFNIRVEGGREPVIICSEYPMYEEAAIPSDYNDVIEYPPMVHSVSTTEISTNANMPTYASFNYCTVFNPREIRYHNTGTNALLFKWQTNMNVARFVGNFIAAVDNNGVLIGSDGYKRKTIPILAEPDIPTKFRLNETTHDTYNKNEVQKFFRTLFIDRTLDYDLHIIMPISEEQSIEGVFDVVEWEGEEDVDYNVPSDIDITSDFYQGKVEWMKVSLCEISNPTFSGDENLKFLTDLLEREYNEAGGQYSGDTQTNEVKVKSLVAKHIVVDKFRLIFAKMYGITKSPHLDDCIYESEFKSWYDSYPIFKDYITPILKYEYKLWSSLWTRGGIYGNIINGIEMGYTYFDIENVLYGNTKKLLEFIGDEKLNGVEYNGIKYFDNTLKTTPIISFNDKRFDILRYENNETELNAMKNECIEYIDSLIRFITDQTQTWYVQKEGYAETNNFPSTDDIQGLIETLKEKKLSVSTSTDKNEVIAYGKEADNETLDIRKKTSLIYKFYYDAFINILDGYSELYNFNIVSPSKDDNTDYIYQITYSNSKNPSISDKSLADTVSMTWSDKDKTGSSQAKQRFYSAIFEVDGDKYEIKDGLGTNTNNATDTNEFYFLENGKATKHPKWIQMYSHEARIGQNTHKMFTQSGNYVFINGRDLSKEESNTWQDGYISYPLKDDWKWAFKTRDAHEEKRRNLLYKVSDYTFKEEKAKDATIRSVYIANTPQSEIYDLKLCGCSYDIEPQVVEVNNKKLIQAKTKKGEECKIKAVANNESNYEVREDIYYSQEGVRLLIYFKIIKGGNNTYTCKPKLIPWYTILKTFEERRYHMCDNNDTTYGFTLNQELGSTRYNIDNDIVYDSEEEKYLSDSDLASLSDVEFKYSQIFSSKSSCDICGICLQKITHDDSDKSHLKMMTTYEIPILIDLKTQFSEITISGTNIDIGGESTLQSVTIKLNSQVLTWSDLGVTNLNDFKLKYNATEINICGFRSFWFENPFISNVNITNDTITVTFNSAEIDVEYEEVYESIFCYKYPPRFFDKDQVYRIEIEQEKNNIYKKISYLLSNT